MGTDALGPRLASLRPSLEERCRALDLDFTLTQPPGAVQLAPAAGDALGAGSRPRWRPCRGAPPIARAGDVSRSAWR
ncbi:MAG: hypothetical protein H6694_01565 [Candidatus Latescibacteria bacterium]|nr:hypothetical protein [Candidatus Latescibacterota bacterium]